jgi:serine/threonine protein kinase
MATFEKIKTCGKGTYGVVYQANVKSNSDSPNADNLLNGSSEVQQVAVKRNFAELTATWTWSVRELDILSKLKGHPFIVDLLEVSIGDPFTPDAPMTPVRGLQSMKEDKIHFIMEYVEMTCSDYINNTELCKPEQIKIMLTQLLLGVEYMHGRGITHRDLKPANLLVSNKPGETTRLRLADFGMSQTLTKTAISTPGVVTSWYRAPEICCDMQCYDKNSDMWSVGCIAYEFFSTRPYLYKVRDDSGAAFNAILGFASKPVDREVVIAMMKSANFGPSSASMPIRRHSVLNRMKMTRMKSMEDNDGSKLESYINGFNSTMGSIEDFSDLIEKLLVVNPNNRLSATQALAHPFFMGMRGYISSIRERYNPSPPNLPITTVNQCIERKWVSECCRSMYATRHTLKWYKTRIIFHAIELFDRYINYCLNPKNGVKLRDSETPFSGRIHSRTDTEVRFYVIVYLMHKYYSTITYPYQYTEVCPKKYHNEGHLAIAEQFETHFIHEVIRHEIYRDTVLEMSDSYNVPVNDMLVSKLLNGYLNIGTWEGMSSRAMFRKIMGIGHDGSSIPQPLPTAESIGAPTALRNR